MNDTTKKDSINYYDKRNVPYDANSPTDNRTFFEHDISAIIYTNAFKRLSLKSQIIIKPIRDHFRSRMTHTHEVIDNALAIAKGLNHKKWELDLNLVQSIGLAHDLGHTPFGHKGERTLREIVCRVLKSNFNLKIDEEEEHLFFNHASNSARILDFIGDITPQCVNGVLCHSWNPWKGYFNESRIRKHVSEFKICVPIEDIPDTYEAQVVAISDQLTSINHDIEDLIGGEKYTNNGAGELKNKIKTMIDEIKIKGLNITSIYSGVESFISDEKKRSYGRKYRIENIISNVVSNNNYSESNKANECALKLNTEWSIFLDIIETIIRKIIREESWFVGRDAMADAMISVAFNHFWPIVKEYNELLSENNKPKNISIDGKQYGIEETTKYLDHFFEYYKDKYLIENNINKIKNRTKYVKKLWDQQILEKIEMKYNKDIKISDFKNRAINLISLVDFIAGLTDRYCIQIFGDLYKGFLTQG
ncbi:MAG: HD domain-containing protein [Elusimicrobia bacterium]|nr:HD domain-containing protein [Elusimicrobiota bacterium]